MQVHAEPDFLALPPGLARLLERAGERSFFSLAEWFDLIARHARDSGTSIRLYADSADPRVALACMMRPHGRLHGLANFYTMEYGPLLAEHDARGHAAARELIANIARAPGPWSLMRFSALDPHSECYQAMLEGLRSARFAVEPFFDCGNRFEATTGLDFRRYFDARPSQLRNTFRRKSKNATDEGVAFAFYEPGADLDALIGAYETVYGNSWKREEPYPLFMPALMKMAAHRGALRLGIAYVRGIPAAAQFWLVWGRRAVIYKLAHDERHKSLSLGTVLTMHMIERVLEKDRPDEINFGRGDDPYKSLWFSERRERWGIVAANPRTWVGLATNVRSIAGKLRGGFRKALSSRL
jgi:hypothetical protein